MSIPRFEPPAPPVGVIESLASGFETVAGRLSLVLLPLVLDLFLWTGPRITVQPAIEAFYTNFEATWSPVLEQQPPEVREQFELTADRLAEAARELGPQYLPVVRWPMGDVLLLGVPTFVVWQSVAPLPFAFEPPLLEVHSLVTMLALAVLLPMGWSVIGVFYRGLVAQEVRDRRVRLFSLLGRLPLYWLNLAVFVAVLGLLALAVMLPFVMVGLFLFPVAEPLSELVVTAGVFVIMWLGIFASFTVHSVLLNGRWALSALWESVRVVQWNLSSATLLWLLVVGLNLGLGYLFQWAGLTMDQWLVPLAIGVHAFLSTALIAATYVYFKDRYRHWHEMRVLLLEKLSQHVEEQVEHQKRSID